MLRETRILGKIPLARKTLPTTALEYNLQLPGNQFRHCKLAGIPDSLQNPGTEWIHHQPGAQRLWELFLSQ